MYASSAATYGLGEQGYEDTHEVVDKLSPLNPYGDSKNDFDKWALVQQCKPYFWAGIKFFNVYGPRESHKGDMASTIYHFNNQILTDNECRLFKGIDGFSDGEQKRDFIYTKHSML